jgi:cytochrome c-550 PedF
MKIAIRAIGYFALLASLTLTKHVLAEGYVRPTPVDTSAIPQLGDTQHMSNPYSGDASVIETGAHAYLLNCSGCHGLEAESGGMAPDLRLLSDSADDDEWFINRVRGGYTQNGVNKMPAYEGTLSQEGMWAIRSYVLSLQ